MVTQGVLMKVLLAGGIAAVVVMLALLLKPQLDGFQSVVRRLSNLERAFLAGFLVLFVAYGGTKPPTPPDPPEPPAPPDPPVVEPVVTNTITYLGLEGAANTNVTEFTTNDLPLVLRPVAREGYTFLGWTPDGGVIPAGTVTNVTFTATWEKQEDPPEPPEPPTPDQRSIVDDLGEIDDLSKFPATTYDGYLYDEESGAVEGLIQVKAEKAKYNKKTNLTTTKLTIGIQLADETKKISISGEYDLGAGGEQTFTEKKGRSVTLVLGSNGLTGSFEGYAVEAVANVYALKNAASKEKAKDADAKYVGAYNVFAEEGAVTVSVAKKGKAKVAGTLSDGTKLSASAQLLVGDGIACATFVVPKQGLAFAMWFGEETTVVGLTDPVVGTGSDLKGQANAFYVDVDALTDALAAAGARPLADFVPFDVPVASNGKKWTVAGGAKAGKIKYDASSDLAWDDKASANPAGLSLSYSAKTGTFTGSFKVYGVVKGKLKSYMAKVTGVLVNGRGYGYAIISKVGSATVWIEPGH